MATISNFETSVNERRPYTPPKFNIAPEKWWLEGYLQYLLGRELFRGYVKLRGGYTLAIDFDASTGSLNGFLAKCWRNQLWKFETTFLRCFFFGGANTEEIVFLKILMPLWFLQDLKLFRRLE